MDRLHRRNSKTCRTSQSSSSIRQSRLKLVRSRPEPMRKPSRTQRNDFSFAYKRDVKAHLDRYVIKQDEAKKVLSAALCDHYNAVREAFDGKNRATTPSKTSC